MSKETDTTSEWDPGTDRQRPTSHDHPPDGSGGADWNRTSDPLLAKQVLSQLSYSPSMCWKESVPDVWCMVLRKSGLRWWAWIELNYRPRAYQARALTN
jgi:hypothetical protein